MAMVNAWWHHGAPQPDQIFFSANDREWITRKWTIIRDAQQKADKAVNDWRKLSDEVNDWMDRTGLTDPLQRAKVKGENLTLNDLFALGQWYGKEAQRHIDDVNLFLHLKQVGLL